MPLVGRMTFFFSSYLQPTWWAASKTWGNFTNILRYSTCCEEWGWGRLTSSQLLVHSGPNPVQHWYWVSAADPGYHKSAIRGPGAASLPHKIQWLPLWAVIVPLCHRTVRLIQYQHFWKNLHYILWVIDKNILPQCKLFAGCCSVFTDYTDVNVMYFNCQQFLWVRFRSVFLLCPFMLGLVCSIM